MVVRFRHFREAVCGLGIHRTVGRLDMGTWEKAIQNHYRNLNHRIEWIHLAGGAVFLLAWKGKGVRVVFVDLKNRLKEATAADAREEFLVLLSYLIRQSSWERVFKGREVLFEWLTHEEPSDMGKKTLAEAGVEPFWILGFSPLAGE